MGTPAASCTERAKWWATALNPPVLPGSVRSQTADEGASAGSGNAVRSTCRWRTPKTASASVASFPSDSLTGHSMLL